ncbi:MAG: carotenoid biosynthesis protein [Candidatus Njordarchaeia archaeon]
MEDLYNKFKTKENLILTLFLFGILYKDEFVYLGIAFFVIIYLSIRGWRRAWVLFVVGMILGFFFEFLGTRTGIPFGWYYYDRLSLQFYGVSIYVPIMWGIYTFETYLFARQVSSGWKACVLVASLLVILDLVLDPFMTSWKAWVWVTKTKINWFGIPWTNYVGWFVTSFTIVLAYLGVVQFVWKGDEGYELDTFVEMTAMPYLFELLSFYIITMGTPANLAALVSLILGCSVIIFLILCKRFSLRLF